MWRMLPIRRCDLFWFCVQLFLGTEDLIVFIAVPSARVLVQKNHWFAANSTQVGFRRGFKQTYQLERLVAL
jgi:hypothetical protein